MKFYDMHIHSAFSEGESTLEEIVRMAKRLKYSGICFTAYPNREKEEMKLKSEIEKIKKETGMEILLGFEARDIKELRNLANRRREFDVLLARGGDLDLNREACETPEVDILTHPGLNRTDPGLDHTSAKFASKNKIAIEINFREILIPNKKTRARSMSNIESNIKLARKYKTPVIICSGAVSHWELRSPEVLISIASQLGMDQNEARNSVTKVPENIIKKIKERRDEKWIMPGVKVIK